MIYRWFLDGQEASIPPDEDPSIAGDRRDRGVIRRRLDEKQFRLGIGFKHPCSHCPTAPIVGWKKDQRPLDLSLADLLFEGTIDAVICTVEAEPVGKCNGRGATQEDKEQCRSGYKEPSFHFVSVRPLPCQLDKSSRSQ